MQYDNWIHRLGATAACVAAALVAAGCGGDSDSKAKPEKKAGKETATDTLKTTSTEVATTDTVATEPTDKEEGKSFSAEIVNGQPDGGPQIWRAKKGDQVKIVVTSDTADELHLHAPYDISKDVAAGGSATLSFVADISGSTELELEETGVLIGNLEVR